jgi:hypothetical protein
VRHHGGRNTPDTAISSGVAVVKGSHGGEEQSLVVTKYRAPLRSRRSVKCGRLELGDFESDAQV